MIQARHGKRRSHDFERLLQMRPKWAAWEKTTWLTTTFKKCPIAIYPDAHPETTSKKIKLQPVRTDSERSFHKISETRTDV